MFQLKAQGHHEGQDTFEERLAIAKQLQVGRFVVKIDGDSAVVSRQFGRCAMCPPCGKVLVSWETPSGEHVEK